MVPEVGIAPTSPRLQRGANLPQLLGVRLRALCDDKWLAEPKLGERRLVVPASKHFRAGTSLPVISRGLAAVGKHLLSYETISSCAFEPKRRDGRNTRFTFAVGRMRLTRFGL